MLTPKEIIPLILLINVAGIGNVFVRCFFMFFANSLILKKLTVLS